MAIEVAKNMKQVEAIITGNASHKTMKNNSYFNKLLLEKENGSFKDIPKEILAARPWFTGTGFAIEAKNKAFGDKVEKPFTHEGSQKTLVYYVRKDDIGAKNLMHLFEQGFRSDGEALIQLFNAKTEKQITTMEQLGEADEVILKVVGEIRNFNLSNRNGGTFERVYGETTNIYASDDSALGFLLRGVNLLVLGYDYRWGVYAGEGLGGGRGVLFEGDAKTNGFSGKQAQVERLLEEMQANKDNHEKLGELNKQLNEVLQKQ